MTLLNLKLTLVFLTIASGVTHVATSKSIIKDKEEKIKLLYDTKEIVKIVDIDTLFVEKECDCPIQKKEVEIKWETEYKDTCYKGIIKVLADYKFEYDSLTIPTNYGILRVPLVKEKLGPLHVR